MASDSDASATAKGGRGPRGGRAGAGDIGPIPLMMAEAFDVDTPSAKWPSTPVRVPLAAPNPPCCHRGTFPRSGELPHWDVSRSGENTR